MHPQFLNRIFKPWMYNIKLFIMKNLELKKMSLANIEDTLSVCEMEEIMAGSMDWECATDLALLGLTFVGAFFVTSPIGAGIFAASFIGGAATLDC